MAKEAVRYLEFIASCAAPETGRVERHHILPKSLFPKYKKDLDNIRELRMRDHVWAHYYLCQVFPKSLKMAYAYNQMIGRDSEAKSIQELAELYEIKKIETGEACRKRTTGRKQSPETIAKRVAKIKGKKRTPEQCAAISRRMKGRKFGPMPEWRKKAISEQHKGRKDSPETTIRRSLAAKGRKKSAEQLEKMRLSQLGKKIYILKDGTRKKMFPHEAIGLEQWKIPTKFENNGRAILNFEKAEEIRSLYKKGNTLTSIAKQYGVHVSTISMITKGKRWRACDAPLGSVVDIETIEGENVSGEEN